MSEHTKGTWREGKAGGSIVTDVPIEGWEMTAECREFYGGQVIAESIAPCNMPLLLSAPDLLVALKWAMSNISPPTRRIAGQNESYCDGYEHAERTLVAAESRATIQSAGGGK